MVSTGHVRVKYINKHELMVGKENYCEVMITKTFKLLPGINKKTEENLLDQGITDWNRFLSTKLIKGLSYKRKTYYDWYLMNCKKALNEQNSSFFVGKLTSLDSWRLYDYFRDECVFLDIETTGLSSYDKITLIGLYDGIETKTIIKDVNYDIERLAEDLKKYKLIVTFNGASFDLPFIEKRHPGLIPQIPHIDLRHVCASLGYTGGLKKIEKHLGVKRSNELVSDLTGGDAVTLWKMYKSSGDDHYLNLLVEYNEEDVINLKQIMEHCWGKLTSQ